MEQLIFALLERAETWATRAGTTLARRNTWTPATFTSGRRPEERALLSAAAEVYDLLGATAEGCQLLAEMGLDPDAAGNALPTHGALSARFAEHRARVAAARLIPAPAEAVA